MNCGRLSARNAVRNGFGWPSIERHAQSWASRSAHAPKRRHASCGPRFHQSTASVRLPTRIFGMPTQQCFRPNVIEPSAKSVAKPIISSASTTPCANAAAGWCAKRSRFQRSWLIMSALFGISYTTITHNNARSALSLLLHDYLFFYDILPVNHQHKPRGLQHIFAKLKRSVYVP